MAGPTETYTEVDIGDILTGKMPTMASMDLLRENQEHLKEAIYDSGTVSTSTAWVALASSTTDADSPIDTTLADALRDRTQHLYEALQSHTHDGTAGAASGFCIAENLLHCGMLPRTDTSSLWVRSGFNYTNDERLPTAQTSGQYIKQILVRNDAPSLAWFGANGADLVASVFVRSSDEQAAGELTIGFSDDSTSHFSGESAAIAHTAIDTTWTRFFYRGTGIGAGHSTNTTFLVKVTSSFTNTITAAGFMVSHGNRLAPFTISNIEGNNYSNMQWSLKPSAPVMDERIALWTAVEAS